MGTNGHTLVVKVLIFTIYSFIFSINSVCSQTNLIRNGSFEEGNPNKPKQISLIHKSDHWDHYWEPGQIKKTTSDWFKHADNSYMRGRIGCETVGTLYFINSVDSNVVPLQDGIAHAGTIKWIEGWQGEGLQQKLQNRLDRGFYELSFWYLIPCSSKEYAFSVYLSNTINDQDHLVMTNDLDTTIIGEWRYFSRKFYVSEHNEYDWFLLLFEGSPGPTQGTGAYMYWDNFQLSEVQCNDCIASGAISYNPAVPDQFMPDYNGVRNYPMDHWCIHNINNAIGIEFTIYDRAGGEVYGVSEYNPNGFFDYDICWDGFTNQNDTVESALGPFFGIAKFFNCDEEVITDAQWFELLPRDSTSDGIYVNQFSIVPEEWGQPALPFATPYQHLYGGEWTGVHSWWACDRIFTGHNTQTHVQYFRAAANSTLRMNAMNVVIHGPGTFFPFGSNVVSKIDTSIQCCPTLRMAAPGTNPKPIEAANELSALPEVIQSPAPQEAVFTVVVLPNPFDETLTFGVDGLPQDETGQLEILDLTGRVLMVKELMNGFTDVETGNLADGVYLWRVRGGVNQFAAGRVLKASAQ